MPGLYGGYNGGRAVGVPGQKNFLLRPELGDPREPLHRYLCLPGRPVGVPDAPVLSGEFIPSVIADILIFDEPWEVGFALTIDEPWEFTPSYGSIAEYSEPWTAVPITIPGTLEWVEDFSILSFSNPGTLQYTEDWETPVGPPVPHSGNWFLSQDFPSI